MPDKRIGAGRVNSRFKHLVHARLDGAAFARVEAYAKREGIARSRAIADLVAMALATDDATMPKRKK